MNNESTKAKGWRGGKSAPRQTRPTRAWQTAETVNDPAALNRRRQRRRFIAWFAVASLVVGSFIYFLLYRPLQTPIIAIVATEYDLPLPPNAWAREDLDGLGQLHQESLHLVDITGEWKSRSRGMREWEERIKAAVPFAKRSGCLILYISMHGAVNGAGEPCLIPPSASANNTQTWLPVRELLESLREIGRPEDFQTLLILDCQRFNARWEIGVPYNSFAHRLPEIVEAVAIPGLHLLTSAGPGEVAQTSSELRSTVFGHFLRLGLGGAADSPQFQGDSDGSITISELHHYLSQRVDSWSLATCGYRQRPQLITHSTRRLSDLDNTDAAPTAETKHVAWSLNRWQQRRLAALPPEDELSAAKWGNQLKSLWKSYADFSLAEPERLDPIAWNEFQRKLVWLDSAIASGRGYHTSATRVLNQLEAQVARTRSRLSAHQTANSLQTEWDLFSDRKQAAPAQFQAHSLPMAGYLGSVPPEIQSEVRELLARFPIEGGAKEILQQLPADRDIDHLSEVHFLRLLDHGWTRSSGLNADVLSNAIAIRTLGEKLAVPRDERVQFWTEPTIQAGDTARRLAEDQLFAGNNAQEQWSLAREQYERAAQVTKSITEAYLLRDRCWSDLVYFLQWLTLPVRQGQRPLIRDEEINQKLLGMTRDLDVLDETLSQDGKAQTDQSQLIGIADLVNRISARREALQKLLDDEYERLLDSSDSVSVLDDLKRILSVPLLPRPLERLGLSSFEQRRRLVERLATMSAALFNPAIERDRQGWKIDSNELPTVPFDDLEYLEFLYSVWSAHPVFQVQGAEKNNDGDLIGVHQRLAAAGERLRRRTQMIEVDLDGVVPGNVNSIRDLRQRSARLERVVRTAVWIPQLSFDPIAKRRLIDTQQLILTQCRRVLGDFWGSAGGARKPFFEATAESYLVSAASQFPRHPVLIEQIRELNDLNDRRVTLAQRGLQLQGRNIVLVNETEKISADVTVLTPSIGSDVKFPEGTGVIVLSDTRGWINSGIAPVNLPLGKVAIESSPSEKPGLSKSVNIPLQGADLGTRGPKLDATFQFRGHDWRTSFILNSSGGVRVGYEPYEYEAPKITLLSGQRKQLAIMFVLDCSQSMGDPSDIEAPGRTHTRLHIAKAAIDRMLRRLAELNSARVGVVLVGHRVGWSTTEPGKLHTQINYGRKIPGQVQPFEDVETILNLGRFDGKHANGVRQLLQTVEPWGESPLYLGIQQALNEFGAPNPDTEQCVIVVTDGLNYQFNPALSKLKTCEDVAKYAQPNAVPIHIVGYSISEDEQAKAATEFGYIADATGGSYVPAVSSSSLIEAIERFLRAGTYTVVDNNSGDLQRSEYGKTTPIKMPDKPATYVVSASGRSADVVVTGGEAVELTLTKEGRIETASHSQGAPVLRPLLRGSPPTTGGEMFGVHQPIRIGDGIQFEFSLQHDERRFLGRPAEVWIEVRPIEGQNQRSEQRYIFYDPNFEPQTTVPILKWRASDWPKAATQAEVRVWLKDTPTTPTRVHTYADLSKQGGVTGVDQTLSALPGLRYQVGISQTSGYRIDVVERHDDASPGVNSLKVEWHSRKKPDLIVRRFDATNRIATHSFIYNSEGLKIDEVTKDAELRLTTREAVLAEAFTIDKPVIIPLADAHGVITPPKIPRPDASTIGK